MNVFIFTFGCKVNSFESSAMAQLLRNAGHEICASDAAADAVIINSCTVTANGDKKVHQYLRRIKRERPEVITVLTGCFPQAFPDEAKRCTEADIICGTGERGNIAALLSDYAEKRARLVEILPNAQKRFEVLTADSMDGHTRAFMKIEDGCDRFCAYCIIPFARGPVRSMALEDIIAQAQTFVRSGYREIVLSGINLSKYGSDLGLTLAHAVEQVNKLQGVERIRLSSLEPDLMDEQLLDRLAGCEKLCAQFHLSLQSGCDETLARMRRRYNTEQYRRTVESIRSRFKRPVFTTDIIVGFAGETEDEFEKSLAFAREMEFLKIHVFPYSRREGTAAAKFPDQISSEIKAQRASRMSAVGEETRERVIRSFSGESARVILEQPCEGGGFGGYTDRYLPAVVRGEGLSGGMCVRGVITGIENGRCVVEPLASRAVPR